MDLIIVESMQDISYDSSKCISPIENCMNNHVESLMLDQSGGEQNLEPEMI